MKIIVNKEDIKKFDESEIGKVKNAYLKRSTIIGVILIMCSLIYTIFDIFNNGEIFDYILSATIFLFGIYFIVYSKRLKKKEVNRFIHESKKTSKK